MRNSTRLFLVLVLAAFLQVTVAAPAHAGFLGSVVSGVKNAVSGVVSTVKNTVSNVVGSVTNGISGVVNSVKSGVSSVVEGFKSGGISGALSAAKGALGGVIGSVKDGVSGVLGALTGAGKEIYGQIKETVKNIVGSITGSLPDAVSQVAGQAGKLAEQATKTAEGILGGSGSPLSGMLDKLKSLGAGDIAEKIQGGLDNLKKFVSEKGASANEFLSMVKDMGINLFEKAKGEVAKLGDAGAKLGEFGKSLFKKGVDAVNPVIADLAKMQETLAGKAAERALDIGKFISGKAAEIPGFAEKLKSGALDLWKKGNEAADKLKFDAAKTISENFDKLTSLRGNPIKFNETFGNMFSAKSADGKASASMSMAGFNLTGGPDDLGQANNEISKHQVLLKGEAWLGPRIDAKVAGSYLNGKGQISLENRLVAGLDGQVEGNAKWLTGGALIDAKAKASVTAGIHNTTTFKNKIDLGGGYASNTTAVVDAMAGAQAKANGTLYMGKNGLEVKGGAEARVGLWADASGSTSMQYKGQNLFTAEGSAGAGLGVGAGAKGGVSFRADKVGFSAQVTLGPVKLGGGIYVNPVAMTEMAVDKGKQALTAVGNGLNKVGDGAKKLWDKLF